MLCIFQQSCLHLWWNLIFSRCGLLWQLQLVFVLLTRHLNDTTCSQSQYSRSYKLLLLARKHTSMTVKTNEACLPQDLSPIFLPRCFKLPTFSQELVYFNTSKFILESSTSNSFNPHLGPMPVQNCINVDLLFGPCQICICVYMVDFSLFFTQWGLRQSPIWLLIFMKLVNTNILMNSSFLLNLFENYQKAQKLLGWQGKGDKKADTQ